MDKKQIGIVLCLLCFCLSLIPCHVWAVSTEDALEPIMPAEACTLTISYCYGDMAFSGLPVKLYQIAAVSADYQYTLTEEFAGSGLVLNGIRTEGEWNVVRSTLEAYILAHDIQPDRIATTDSDGRSCVEALETGMYLALAEEATYGELQCYFAPALVALPGLGTDGYWQYQVEVNAKAEVLPPPEQDGEKELKVVKLWKGDASGADRPQSIEIEIFRNNISYETVILSEGNNWCYSWTVKDDGAKWMVAERNIPDGYTMTVDQKGTSFVVTNTLEGDEPPSDPPGTGDTFNLLPPMILMCISGSLLILLGTIGKRFKQ